MKLSLGVGAILMISTLGAVHKFNAPSPGNTVNSIATAWFRASTARNPESATQDTGWMAPLAAEVFDNSPSALIRWHRYEDSVFARFL